MWKGGKEVERRTSGDPAAMPAIVSLNTTRNLSAIEESRMIRSVDMQICPDFFFIQLV